MLAILDGHYKTAFVLFVIAGITDGLDGLAARMLRQQTMLGQYLDPVADKLLLSTLFLTLTHVGFISWRVTVLVFGRDLGILVVSAILYIGLGDARLQPEHLWEGKYPGADSGFNQRSSQPVFCTGMGSGLPQLGAGRHCSTYRRFRLPLHLEGGAEAKGAFHRLIIHRLQLRQVFRPW